MKNYYDFDLNPAGWRKGDIYRNIQSREKDSFNNRWGILIYIVEDIKKHNVTHVRILDTDDNSIYICKSNLFTDQFSDKSKHERGKIWVKIKEFNRINYTKQKYFV